MRADAKRNYDRIVAVAGQLFAERGTDASLEEVAKRAGIGAGTLYRHFPTREDLLDVVMGDWVDQVATAADQATHSHRSPREQLIATLTTAVTALSAHRGAAAKLMAAMDDAHSPLHGRGMALARANRAVVDRLAAHGALREGVQMDQICWLTCGLAAIADHGGLDATAMAPLIGITADGLLR